VDFIWDIVRAWVEKNPVNEKRIEKNVVAKTILSHPKKAAIDFTIRRDANPVSRQTGLVRYQENPTAFWGPGSRAAVK